MACPEGSRVVGGGVHMSGVSLETEIRSSAPYASQGENQAKPDDGWSTQANAGPSDETMTAFGICLSDAPKLRYLQDKAVAKPGNRARTNVSCGNGWEVLGGGVESQRHPLDTTEIVMVSSVPQGAGDSKTDNDGWAGIIQNDTGKRIQTTAWAICAKAKSVKISSGPATTALVGHTQDYVDTPECSNYGPEYQLTGGGGRVKGNPRGIEVATLEPRDYIDGDSDRDDYWRTWFNNESGITRVMASYGICAKFK